MKKITLLLLCFYSLISYGARTDTVTIKSNIKKATVFFGGAEVTRESKTILNKGKHILVLDKLPAEMNTRSIQVKTSNDIEILSVKHELTQPKIKTDAERQFDQKIKKRERIIIDIKNQIDVYNIEEKILLENSKLNGKEQATSIEEIKQAGEFYRTKLNEIRKAKLDLTIKLDSLQDNVKEMYRNLNIKVADEKKSYSRIYIAVESKVSKKAQFDISYFVNSAGWIPEYDFRVQSVNDPLRLVYNAKLFQSTGEDWNNIDLTLSTNQPSLSNEKPLLDRWDIEQKNSHIKKINTVSRNGISAIKGTVVDASTGEPVPFANISVIQNGEVITGGMTDFEGQYMIKPVTPGTYSLKSAYVGYQAMEYSYIRIPDGQIVYQDFKLSPSAELLDEVIIKEYSVPLIKKDETSSGVTFSMNEKTRDYDSYSHTSSKKIERIYVDGIKAVSNISNLEYQIETPYTIPSDGEDYQVKIQEVKMPVDFNYYATPKLDKDAFLTTEIIDWYKLNLLSGNASIYYDGTFTGQTYIDANSTKDTLAISLSRDKQIVITRELNKDKQEKKIMGSSIRETIEWDITVRNTKAEKVTIFVEDQFPISHTNSIDIERLEWAEGKLNEKTGIVVWELELEPNEKKTLNLKYSVKYPKYKQIYIN